MQKIVFDGQFYSQRAAGMYRYADEILKQFDRIIDKDEFEILVPEYVNLDGKFQNIKVVHFGKVKGILWSQISLPQYLWRGNALCVEFCNVTPLIRPGITVVHDIGYKVLTNHYKNLYGRLSSLWHRLNYWVVAKSRPPIITVSEFSKEQIQRVYHVNPNRIHIIGAGWQHFLTINDDEIIFERYPAIRKGNYYFSLGSLEERKNFRWIMDVANRNPEETFVIAGGDVKNVKDKLDFSKSKNIVFLGYISNSEIKALMRYCKAFLFPSTFEGFGLPPMEALSVGAKAVVSNISVHKEVYEDATYYVDPSNSEINLQQLLAKPVADPEKILEKYSWEKSAKELLELLNYISFNQAD